MSRSHNVLRSEINVTPLVDVVLVLLILFMVIVPATLRGHDVEIPATTDRPQQAEAARDQIVLTVALDDCPVIEPPGSVTPPGACRVRLGDRLVPLTELGRSAAELFTSRPADARVLFLAADDRLNYEGVMQILDQAKASVAGLRVGIANPAL